MFSGLLYLIIVLLICVLSPDGFEIRWIESPVNALFLGCAGFIALLGFIYAGSRFFLAWIKKHKNLSLHILNALLIGYLCVYNFLLSAQRIVTYVPDRAFEATLCALMNCIIYFIGIGVYVAGSYYPKYFDLRDRRKAIWTEVTNNFRMWLPFVIPFFLLTIIGDALMLLPETYWFKTVFALSNDADRTIISLMTTTLLFAGLIIFSPYLIQKLWLCKPIEDVDLWLRLAKVARQAQFKCAEFSIWTVMGQFHTAAIIGLFPRFRYVMFTERLIEELPPESIEAILVHEIGHSYRKHLMILPFIILGMFGCAALFTFFFFDGISNFIALHKAQSGSIVWDVLPPIALIIPMIIIFGLYYRFIFGFYSRLFERQADLHPAVVGIPLQNMINALDQIAIVTGNTHDQPSWHHYSVRERMNYLESVIAEPTKAAEHHRRVRFWVFVYFIFFAILSILLLAISFQDVPFLNTIAQPLKQVNQTISRYLSTPQGESYGR